MSRNKAPFNWVMPFDVPTGRTVRILIYARYSTEEQNPRSIEDQILACRRFVGSLLLNPDQVQIDVQSDAAVSGEIVSRPGIDTVRDNIRAGRVNWLVTEEASRFFRSEAACFDLVGEAVDANVRVICISDRIDTLDEDEWESRLLDAVGHHAKSNRHTRQRIRRALIARHEMGAALGPVKPGYYRTPTHPATEKLPARGPFYDDVDNDWCPVIVEAFERIAAGQPPWLVASWLTEKGLPKTANSLRYEWTANNVKSMIKNPIYIGKGQFRVTTVKKIHATGQSKQVRNEEEEILVKTLPHLRIISEHLYNAANHAISARRTGPDNSKAAAHPLSGLPRDSRGPLSGILLCDICGEAMHINGRRQGAYRCRCLKDRQGSCWNRATAERALTHERIGNAIGNELVQFVPKVEQLLSQAQDGIDSTSDMEARLATLRREVETLTAQRNRYVLAISAAEDVAIPQLTSNSRNA